MICPPVPYVKGTVAVVGSAEYLGAAPCDVHVTVGVKAVTVCVYIPCAPGDVQ